MALNETDRYVVSKKADVRLTHQSSSEIVPQTIDFTSCDRLKSIQAVITNALSRTLDLCMFRMDDSREDLEASKVWPIWGLPARLLHGTLGPILSHLD